MLKKFIERIEEIYELLKEPIDYRFKLPLIDKYKDELNIEDGSFGNTYFKLLKKDKNKGIVYTPKEIGEYIVENTIYPNMIIENPYLKICDPACGCGNILIPCYEYLKKVYLDNLDFINERNNLNLSKENIDEHIIKKNIYGFDIDEKALKVLTLDLFYLSHCVLDNVVLEDFLIEGYENKFDVFIGNPPYVGQKSIHKEYSSMLKKLYKEIYKDKGDLSYCFFEKAIECLKIHGTLGFITSRYFLESPSGEGLRRILNKNCIIYKIVDFYGIRPFKSVGIDPVIIFLNKESSKQSNIEIIKPLGYKGMHKKNFYDSLFFHKGEEYRQFSIENSYLNDKGWRLIDKSERNIIKKIESKSLVALKDICESYQGIITGCDKAFVIEENVIKEKNIEKDIIKPWIKSSNIDKYKIKKADKYLIYSDLIDNEKDYPNAIKYINAQKEKLINRREYKKGYRKWYELQWGRNIDIFEEEKIIFPYKANKNRFAVDKSSYFSADVYSLVLKENVNYSYKFLLFLLNSRLYEFYFKTFAKKLGEDIFEYYPNNLMKLLLPKIFTDNYSNERVIYDYFCIDKEEIRMIEEYCK